MDTTPEVCDDDSVHDKCRSGEECSFFWHIDTCVAFLSADAVCLSGVNTYWHDLPVEFQGLRV